MTSETSKTVADWAAGGITLAALVQWLPPAAAALTILYTMVRFTETRLFEKCLRIACAKCAEWWES